MNKLVLWWALICFFIALEILFSIAIGLTTIKPDFFKDAMIAFAIIVLSEMGE